MMYMQADDKILYQQPDIFPASLAGTMGIKMFDGMPEEVKHQTVKDFKSTVMESMQHVINDLKSFNKNHQFDEMIGKLEVQSGVSDVNPEAMLQKLKDLKEIIKDAKQKADTEAYKESMQNMVGGVAAVLGLADKTAVVISKEEKSITSQILPNVLDLITGGNKGNFLS